MKSDRRPLTTPIIIKTEPGIGAYKPHDDLTDIGSRRVSVLLLLILRAASPKSIMLTSWQALMASKRVWDASVCEGAKPPLKIIIWSNCAMSAVLRSVWMGRLSEPHEPRHPVFQCFFFLCLFSKKNAHFGWNGGFCVHLLHWRKCLFERMI